MANEVKDRWYKESAGITIGDFLDQFEGYRLVNDEPAGNHKWDLSSNHPEIERRVKKLIDERLNAHFDGTLKLHEQAIDKAIKAERERLCKSLRVAGYEVLPADIERTSNEK